MKINPASLFFAAAALCAAPLVSAQVVQLDNFTAFETPSNTIFLGNWAANGDPVSGDSTPRAGFTQGVGVYNFLGGSNADTASVYRFFDTSPLLLGSNTLLAVSARLLAGNTAPTFTIALIDSNFTSAFAVFATASFNAASLTTVSAALTFSDPAFNRSDLFGYQLTGGVLNGTGTLSISLDNLAATAPRVLTPVPEPATYGVFAVAALGAAAFFSRRRVGRV